MSQTHLVEVNSYRFSAEALTEIAADAYAANNWPLVYILSDGSTRRAYAGETTDTITRLGTHLKHPQKQFLTTVHLVSSERFNKSATLDIESSPDVLPIELTINGAIHIPCPHCDGKLTTEPAQYKFSAGKLVSIFPLEAP